MFDRKELKARAKAAFKRNYWKCVLVALIVSLLTAAAASGSAVKNRPSANIVEINNMPYTQEQLQNMTGEELIDAITNNPTFDGMSKAQANTIVGIAAAAILGALAIGSVTVSLLRIFVWNVFAVGGARFFEKNTIEPAKVGEILFAFKNNYLSNVICMLLRALFVALWSLLLIIPGIIKHYSWYLVPYIIADDPYISREEAFALSTELMRGNKWSTFVMELSFIGWEILSGITGGILGVFYVNPYKYSAFAELYRELRYGRGVSYIG